MKTLFKAIFLISLFSATHYSYAGSNADNSAGNINTDIEALKNEVLELNRDLTILEEDLLFSVNTQINVFLSMDAKKTFHLNSVQLKIDDVIVSNYLYADSEIEALNQGGIQKLHLGNLRSGAHEITAIFTGLGSANRTLKYTVSKRIKKTIKAQFVELKIIGNTSKGSPEFSVNIWEK